MNQIDLHMHSTCSDGTMTPRELIVYAKEKGLRTISVTDHDTISHIKDVLTAAAESDIEVIPGIEVSAEYDARGTMHILGYYIDPENDEIYDMLQDFRDGRDERNPKIIARLNELGLKIEYKDILKESAGQSVGRPHIARVLVNKGYVKDTKEAFDVYLAKGALAYFDRVRFSPEKIISVIHASGGLAFLAHPKQLGIKNRAELETLIEQLIVYGLDGIEVYSSCHMPKNIKLYLDLAKKYDLLISGGSDFHGGTKGYIDMGSIGDAIQLEYAIVEQMKARLKTRQESKS
jgi:3',5'-nucleoside bisphosphate phosphatase